ncbi:hypothetical protein CIHG_08759 [Coccidioides immitis H538.4]|uniref:Uncharacterized protein n=2 Tax=Coccidioides immitis TaxID=5501 RepID=A0A0J8S406_COCIT|nr:hypothetical protein CIRG_09465 [Coccidioides immitis RMSCC 2394]KMU91089.1 hypothetical protein CIHG_08759 [Coccidioides immitis H538.4]
MQQCDYLVWTTYKGQIPCPITWAGSHCLVTMSKALDAAKTQLRNIKNAPGKFTEHVVEGTRIIPSMTKDHQIPVRVDAAKYDAMTKLLNVVLQVNSKPQSPGLQEWIKKHSTHAKLATAKFDTAAEDKNAEYHRVLDELIAQGKENLKNGEKAD